MPATANHNEPRLCKTRVAGNGCQMGPPSGATKGAGRLPGSHPNRWLPSPRPRGIPQTRTAPRGSAFDRNSYIEVGDPVVPRYTGALRLGSDPNQELP